MVIAQEEIFGPVMSVFKFKTIEEVIQRSNDTRFGLASGIRTTSIDTALKIAHGLRAGSVWINTYGIPNLPQVTTPFGGFKDSGSGRELGFDGIKNYLETKTVIIRRSDDSLP